MFSRRIKRQAGGEDDDKAPRLTQILVFPSGTGGRASGTDIGKNFEIRPIVEIALGLLVYWFIGLFGWLILESIYLRIVIIRSWILRMDLFLFWWNLFPPNDRRFTKLHRGVRTHKGFNIGDLRVSA